MAMNPINSWEDVPLFDREEAEAAFWEENRIDLVLDLDPAAPPVVVDVSRAARRP